MLVTVRLSLSFVSLKGGRALGELGDEFKISLEESFELFCPHPSGEWSRTWARRHV